MGFNYFAKAAEAIAVSGGRTLSSTNKGFVCNLPSSGGAKILSATTRGSYYEMQILLESAEDMKLWILILAEDIRV